jgi:tetratricopeptide (TPR) repeat protein
MGPIDHIAAQYVDPAPGLTLAFYFRDEDIKFEVSLYNEGQSPIHLGWDRSDIQRRVSFRWINLPEEQVDKNLRIEPYELVSVPKNGKLEQVEKVIDLQPGDSVAVRWRLRTVNESPLAPGRYELAANPLLPGFQEGKVNDKVRLNVNNHHVFEVREALTVRDNIERLLRNAIRGSWRGDYDGAIQKLNQALVLHSNSQVAYILLGTFNSQRGHYEDAVRAYQRAIEIMESDLDRLIPEYRKRSPHWNSAIQRLKQQLEITKAKIK